MSEHLKYRIHQVLLSLVRQTLKLPPIGLLAALILPFRLYCKLISQVVEVDGNQWAETAIVCFSRNLFNKDLKELASRAPNYKWVHIPVQLVAHPQKLCIPRKYQKQTQFSASEAGPDTWAACVKFARTFNQIFKEEHKARAILDANFDYWQSYAFCRAYQEGDLPVFVLSKENPSTSAAQRAYQQRYAGFRFTGTAIACPSQGLRDTLASIGVIDTTHLWVTGYPRLDRYRTLVSDVDAMRHVTFLTFASGYAVRDQNAYMNTIDELTRLVTAQSRPPKVFIKPKSLVDANQHRERLAASRSDVRNSAHVLPHWANVHELCMISKVVVGANSQALIETLLTDTSLVIPQFLFEADDDSNFFRHDEDLSGIGIYICRNSREFQDTIASVLNRIREQPLSEAVRQQRVDVLNRFVSYDPGASSASRVVDMLGHYIGDRGDR